MTLIATYSRPTSVITGPDGWPNYLSSDKADPTRWTPPAGYRLRVWCGAREMYHVVEADRDRGWVRVLPYRDTPEGPKREAKDGVTRVYHGAVRFRVERIPVGTRGFRSWLRRFAPNVRVT